MSESRDLAQRLGAGCVVVLTMCEDRGLLRRRVEGRERRIPGSHELTSAHVANFLGRWEPPDGDIAVDTGDDPDGAGVVDRIPAFDALT